MSHFLMIAILPPDTREVEATLAHLMAPYSEHLEVPEYLAPCSCRSFKSRPSQLREVSEEEAGLLETIEQVAHSLGAEVYAVSADDQSPSSPEDNSPDPDCPECRGTGTHLSTYNPRSKWDWFQYGGRWTGAFDPNYDPEQDIENQEWCHLCGGTGRRTDELAENFRRENPDFTCNGCEGRGMRVKWPTAWKRFEGDLTVVANIPPDLIPFAILTPDGQWHESGSAGWQVASDQSQADWAAEVRSILESHRDCLAIAVDCHI